MAWQNLSADLDELFGEFTTSTEAMLGALEQRTAWRREYQRRWDRENRKRGPEWIAANIERARAREKRIRADPELKAAENARRRRKRAEARERQRLIVPTTSTPSIAPAS